MKKRYFLLLLHLLGLPALQAQQPDSLTLKLDAVFAHVDKRQVSPGLLADYGLPRLPLAYLDGRGLDDTSRPTLAT